MNARNALPVVFLVCLIAAEPIVADSAHWTHLHSFDRDAGQGPLGALALGPDQKFYGVTEYGGVVNDGVAYRITGDGIFEYLDSLIVNITGDRPQTGVVVTDDGSVFGTAVHGGPGYWDYGTIWTLGFGDQIELVFAFDIPLSFGFYPKGHLIQASDGLLYGTASAGGNWQCHDSGCSDSGAGTVFRMTTDGTLTKLHTFSNEDGADPEGGLFEADDGFFYGTTSRGGRYGLGTIFRIDATGYFELLHSFSGPDGAYPISALVQAADGHLYGTTRGGGEYRRYCEIRELGCGTLFRLNLPEATLTTLRVLSIVDGVYPSRGMIVGSDGHLYGTTYAGGNLSCISSIGASVLYGCGTVYRITTDGDLTTLYSFDGADGFNSDSTLVEDGTLSFLGTTRRAGEHGFGTVFRLTIEDQTFTPRFGFMWPRKGKPGTAVRIFGHNLSGVTSVSFADVPAPYVRGSNSTLTAYVPSGARTGRIKVISPGGTATSPIHFKVLPRFPRPSQ